MIQQESRLRVADKHWSKRNPLHQSVMVDPLEDMLTSAILL